MKTFLIILLLLGASIFAGLWFSAAVRARKRIEAATREHRIALSYIAYRRPSRPQDFALAFLEGNRAAIDRHYHGYAAYRAETIAREREFDDA